MEGKKGGNHFKNIFLLLSSSMAIAGANYCVIAADTRQSEGYSINSRYAPKAFKL